MSYVSTQPLVFFASLGAGAFSAMLYAVLWLLRQGIKNRAFTLVADVFFVTAGAAAYFLCLLATNCGEFRIFSIVAFCGGFALLYFLLRPFRARARAFAERLKAKKWTAFKKRKRESAK